MSYYRLLGLQREPFSTSPDPSFFYLSRVHRAALYRLRIAIELKRGLGIVAGDIGTGKTTLARRMSQIFHEDPRIDFHVILNPMYPDREAFLKHILQSFHLDPPASGEHNSVAYLQIIERYLYRKGVEEGKTVVLLIDEAQQLSYESIEILRTLLNYETSQHKLLQVVLFGQMEVIPKLKHVPNFWDRISLKTRIDPLDEKATHEMIEFRLHQANYARAEPLFTRDAIKRIYKETQGLPRRITLLCHDALEYLVMMNLKQVDHKVVKKVVRREESLLAGVA